ncbi:hypothetical protein RCG17_27830 [Neobacillus sp. PS3-12]|jgi:hypothetical protein|uniref:hypothetical protein n=1 Tax=Neobacillus sp. PS3-12 TaxID=3070677 RepID=UPI0027E10826|nr:hypothetical protein [Neobacillus sp. PS3-12]WML53097.1 hypothetical protein RCG17_27830 [Neobacillus sp. PS3-12]
MVSPTNSNNNKGNNAKSEKILQLEKQVSLGLWIQVIGQIIEFKGLSDLLQIEDDTNPTGEKQILNGVFIRTIGQILEAISVSNQIRETDKARLIEEQKIAIAGDSLVAIGSVLEVIGGLLVLEEETDNISFLVP